MPVIFGVGVAAAELLQPLPGAEAAVGMALFNQKLGVFPVQVPALGLDVGPHRAAHQMEQRIPHGEVRTRFAPSPTGYMHVGNLRTALYTWLALEQIVRGAPAHQRSSPG